MIDTPLARAPALFARLAFWRQPDPAVEEMTPEEKAALMAALNPEYRFYFRDEVELLRHFEGNKGSEQDDERGKSIDPSYVSNRVKRSDLQIGKGCWCGGWGMDECKGIRIDAT